MHAEIWAKATVLLSLGGRRICHVLPSGLLSHLRIKLIRDQNGLSGSYCPISEIQLSFYDPQSINNDI